MKIQIVDAQDNLIGIKERNEIDYKTDIYRASALWLTNSKGQTLLARRARAKDKDPGKWGPAVAGTVEENETYDTNIYKEAMEEIGLTDTQFAKGIKMFITHPRRYFCQWYFAPLDRDTTEFIMQAEEVDALAWIDIEQIKQELLNNPNKYVPALPQIIQELRL